MEGRRAPLARVRRGESHAKSVVAYGGAKRYGRFRCIVLDYDRHECVVIGEGSVAALMAKHLALARNCENDMPCNGIALRAHLHRLFDTGLPTSARRVGGQPVHGLQPVAPPGAATAKGIDDCRSEGACLGSWCAGA